MIFSALVIFFTALLMIIGLIGSILPLLPGAPLIFLGAFLYAWHTGFLIVTWKIILFLGLLTLLNQILDYLASIYGAQKYGASRWGMVGALLGGILGTILGGVVGAVVGPILGAASLELLRGTGFRSSFKIGLGALLGFLGGIIGKFIISLIMVGTFLGTILWGPKY